jgi:hypothetical protein
MAILQIKFTLSTPETGQPESRRPQNGARSNAAIGGKRLSAIGSYAHFKRLNIL